MVLRQSAVVFTATHRPFNEINAINLLVMDGTREKDSLIMLFFQINQITKCDIVLLQIATFLYVFRRMLIIRRNVCRAFRYRLFARWACHVRV